MLHRYIDNPNFKSRFRILKGGKISLVVSALAISGALVSPANAADIIINGAETAQQTVDTATSLDVTSTGVLTYTATAADPEAVKTSGSYLGMGKHITNNGTISSENTTTGHAAAISIQNAENQTVMPTAATKIENNSIMSATANGGSASTIDILGAVKGEIINSGTISATATTAARGIHLVGSLLDVNPDTAKIFNTGTITANGVTSATAIDVERSSGYILNANTLLSNAGTLNATANTGIAYGMKMTGHINGDIENSGTINIDATANHARGIEVIGAANGSIVNDGTINVDALGDAFGILLGGADGAGSVTNNGTIIVNGGTSGNPVHQSYGFKTSKAITGGVTNNGTIKATVNGEYDKQGYSLSMRYNEAFTNETNGKLYGNIAAYALTGNVINKGLVSLPYNVNGRDGDGDTGGVANLANFTQDATGTLEIGLLTDGTTSTYSKFLVSNNATFADGSTLGVNVLAASTDVALLEGTTLEDVVSAGNLTLDGTLNITDNSALLDFEYAKDGNTIDLNVIKAIDENGNKVTLLTSTTEGGGDANDKNAAKALQKIQDEEYPEMDQLFASLNTLATDAEVAAAVASTTPQTTTASVGAASQISNGIASIVEQRQQANIGGGLNSGDEMFASKNTWVKVYGSKGKQENQDGLNGFDVDTYGIGIGIDAEYKDNQNIGIALFYTNAGVDVNNVSQSSDMDVFTTLIYGNVPILDGKTNFLYQLGYAIQQTDSTRNLFTGQTAKADYTSKTASVDLKLMKDVEVNKSLLLQPLISTTYRHFDNPAYSETGAGANSLAVDGFTSSEFLVGIGTLAHYKIDEKSKIIGSVKVDYDTKNDNTIVTSSYQGALGVTYATEGIDNGRWQYEAGIGYEIDFKESHNLNFAYNYQAIGSGFSNNVVSARYVYSF